MKPTLILLTIALASCQVVVDERILPDGTKVTTTSKSADPAAIKGALDIANIIAPIITMKAEEQKQKTQ